MQGRSGGGDVRATVTVLISYGFAISSSFLVLNDQKSEERESRRGKKEGLPKTRKIDGLRRKRVQQQSPPEPSAEALE